MNNNIYNKLINLRNNKDTINNSDNFIINYEDNVILNKDLKNFLNVTKDKELVKNIYEYIYNYIIKEKLVFGKKIIVNNKLQDLFKIEKNFNLNIINLGLQINKILFTTF